MTMRKHSILIASTLLLSSLLALPICAAENPNSLDQQLNTVGISSPRPATAVYNETIGVLLNRLLTIRYNGVEQSMKDANGETVYPISYNGTTYLPIRAICDMLGLNIEWDEETNTVSISESEKSESDKSDDAFLKLAEAYTSERITEVQRQQDYWHQNFDGKSSDSVPEIISARVETFDHAAAYKGYQVYKYNGSFLSSDPEKIFCVDEWTIGDDGWYIDLRPQYMIFKDGDSPLLAGVMLCEFTPTGNSEAFYSDLDQWITEFIAPDISDKAEAPEHFADDKTEIYNRMLNTIDYIDRISLTARTNMISTGESILSYDVDIGSGVSYQSVTENDKLVSETFSSTESGIVSVNCTDKTYSEENLPVFTREDTPYIALAERVVYGYDGIPCYYYRKNITNCPLASYCLAPQEATFSYLSDFDTWEIADSDFEYLGRSCVVLSGTPSTYIAAKHKVDSFRMIVDKETGVLLSFEELLGDKPIRYMNVTEINFDDVKTPVRQFDESQYSGYESLTLKNTDSPKVDAVRKM